MPGTTAVDDDADAEREIQDGQDRDWDGKDGSTITAMVGQRPFKFAFPLLLYAYPAPLRAPGFVDDSMVVRVIQLFVVVTRCH